MRLALALLVVAVGAACASTLSVGPWVVLEPASEPWASQAAGIIAAAERLYPETHAVSGGTVVLLPDLESVCAPPSLAPRRYAGCLRDKVYVLWPHPKCPAGADLTCSALAHELCHVVRPLGDESQADACALLVVQEYRRTLP